MNENKDYYNILGVDKSASYEEIKKAFRRLSLELHPDRTNNDPVSTARFQAVSEAWEVLQDENKRKEYDLGGKLFNMGDMNTAVNDQSQKPEDGIDLPVIELDDDSDSE